jgi:hypothetical protein
MPTPENFTITFTSIHQAESFANHIDGNPETFRVVHKSKFNHKCTAEDRAKYGPEGMIEVTFRPLTLADRLRIDEEYTQWCEELKHI